MHENQSKKPFSFVIYSPNEAAVSDGAGFWNNEDGWVEFDEATRFSEDEIRVFSLPISVGGDAKFVEETAARAAYCGPKEVQSARVRLTIDVAYDLSDETAEEMRAFLEHSVRWAIGNGMLSGDTSAEVDEYSVKAELVPDANQNVERRGMRP